MSGLMTLHLGYRPGCMGRIAELHALYYARTVGFGVAFGAKVATELAELCQRYVDGRDGLWLATDGDHLHGSIAIDGACHQQDGAHLRWFITSDEARGKGLGSRLLSAALGFC